MLTDGRHQRRRQLAAATSLLALLAVLYLRSASGSVSTTAESKASGLVGEARGQDLSGMPEGEWSIGDCYILTQCPGACRAGYSLLSLPHPCWQSCCPTQSPSSPPLLPPSPRPPPEPPSLPDPPSPPPDKIECRELSPFHTTVANVQMEEYLRGLELPSPPLPGAERMHSGLLESYRYNVSLLSLKLGPMSLVGCRYKGRHPLSESITSNERLAFNSQMSSWSPFFPDSIRMEIPDVEFTLSVLYHVQELGAYLGGGPVFMKGKGNIWIDDLSIKVSETAPARRHVECYSLVPHSLSVHPTKSLCCVANKPQRHSWPRPNRALAVSACASCTKSHPVPNGASVCRMRTFTLVTVAPADRFLARPISPSPKCTLGAYGTGWSLSIWRAG
jgi:hypothetical protein